MKSNKAQLGLPCIHHPRLMSARNHSQLSESHQGSSCKVWVSRGPSMELIVEQLCFAPPPLDSHLEKLLFPFPFLAFSISRAMSNFSEQEPMKGSFIRWRISPECVGIKIRSCQSL